MEHWFDENSGTFFTDGFPSIEDDLRSKIHNVRLYDGVPLINICAFDGCRNMVSIHIPDSVTTIEDYAFLNCSSLTELTLPEGLEYIGNGVFNGCSKLESLHIPGTVDHIGHGVFMNCPGLKKVTVSHDNPYLRIDERGVIYSANGTLMTGCTTPVVGTYTVPDTVVFIDGFAFYGCSELTDIELPRGLDTICSGAFEGCDGLRSVNIPNNVGFLGGYLFRDCSDLEHVTLPDRISVISQSMFMNCRSLIKWSYPRTSQPSATVHSTVVPS